ncbi:hypothetical protein BHE74_00053131, partial [Ensete ventricosum]
AKVATDSDKTYEFCVYDCDIATGYGVDAILFLLLGQVILTVDTKCFRWGHCLDPGAFHLILSCVFAAFVLFSALLSLSYYVSFAEPTQDSGASPYSPID